MLKASEIFYVNYSVDFIINDKIRFTKNNKNKSYKKKIREQWFYKFFDEYLLCDDEETNKNVHHWDFENTECIDLKTSFFTFMLFKKIDDNVEKQQSQKMQITKRFKVSTQFLNKTHFTLILSLNKIHFTTKFNIVILFAK